MKAFTNLKQSKKLAEFLPLESADMFYYKDAVTKEDNPRIMNFSQVPKNKSMYYFPCWSLAALLDILPGYELNNFGNAIQLDVKREALETEGDETLLDLVVNMIIYLHELKML